MKYLILIFMAVMVFADPSGAEELTLEEVLKQALAQHPELAAARAEAEAAEAAADQAGAWENPALFFRMEGAPRDGDAWKGSERVLGLSQELSIWGARGARGKLGQANANLVRAGLLVTGGEFEAGVRTTYAWAWRDQADLDLKIEAAGIAAQLSDLMERRFHSGDVAEAKFRRARMAAMAVDAAVEVSRAKAAGSMAQLTAVLGSESETQWRLRSPGEDMGKSLLSDGVSPRESALLARSDRAAAAVELTSRERWPALELEAGLRTSPDGDAFDVGVRMELPTWNRKTQSVKEAKALQVAEEYRAESARRQLEASRKAVLARHQAAIKTLGMYKEKVVPDAEASLAATRIAFESGDVDFSEVLQVTREWIAARQGLLDRVLEVTLAEAEVVQWR